MPRHVTVPLTLLSCLFASGASGHTRNVATQTPPAQTPPPASDAVRPDDPVPPAATEPTPVAPTASQPATLPEATPDAAEPQVSPAAPPETAPPAVAPAPTYTTTVTETTPAPPPPPPPEATPRKSSGRFGRGTIAPRLAIGGAFGGDISQLHIGLGATYFVFNGVGLGLGLDDNIIFFSRDLKADYPGIEDNLPTNVFRVMPHLVLLAFRDRNVTPYVRGAVGPVFHNNDGAILGQWEAGPGIFLGSGRVQIDLGVVFTQMFPYASCEETYTFTSAGTDVFIEACGLYWGPHLGIVIGLGG